MQVVWAAFLLVGEYCGREKSMSKAWRLGWNGIFDTESAVTGDRGNDRW